MKKYQVLNQLNTVLLDGVTLGEASQYAFNYMKMYPDFTFQNGKFYSGKKHKKNLRLKIEEQS